MKTDRFVIKPSEEDLYFQEQDRILVEKLRTQAAKEADEAYCHAHRNHCFRCGTRSLIEVDHRNIKIDMCVNTGCGAVHLDPGEMEKIIQGEGSVFSKVRNSVFSVFK